jgi:hypothetical protein
MHTKAARLGARTVATRSSRQSLFAFFPRLAAAASRLEQTFTPDRTTIETAPEHQDVGGAYRPADEEASAAVRDPFSVDPALVERACRGHAATQNALATFLQQRGIAPLSPSSTEVNFDLAWRRAPRFFVAEVKSCTNANIEKQLRLGLGQVLRYRSMLEDALGARVVAVLALEAPLADASWRRLCNGLGVCLVAAPEFEGLDDFLGSPR